MLFGGHTASTTLAESQGIDGEFTSGGHPVAELSSESEEVYMADAQPAAVAGAAPRYHIIGTAAGSQFVAVPAEAFLVPPSEGPPRGEGQG